MVPNEYLYYFYYAADTVDAIRESPRSRGAYLLEQQAALLRAQRPGARRGAGRLARDPPRARAHLHGRGARRRRRRAASTTQERRQRRLRGRGDGGGRGDRQQHPHDADPQHRQPLRAAVPGRARRRRGAGAGRPRRARSRWRSAPCRTTRRRSSQTIKAVERATIEAALTGSRRAGGQGARAAPAGAVRDTRAADLRRLPRAAARAAGALRGEVDVVVTATPFMDLTFIGLEARPAARRGALRRRPAALAGRRRDHRDRRRRLGLTTALAGPLGQDLEGAFIREALRARGHRARHRAARRGRPPPWSCPAAASARW